MNVIKYEWLPPSVRGAFNPTKMYVAPNGDLFYTRGELWVFGAQPNGMSGDNLQYKWYFLYNLNSLTQSLAPANMVTTDTEQNITATKNFTAGIKSGLWFNSAYPTVASNVRFDGSSLYADVFGDIVLRTNGSNTNFNMVSGGTFTLQASKYKFSGLASGTVVPGSFVGVNALGELVLSSAGTAGTFISTDGVSTVATAVIPFANGITVGAPSSFNAPIYHGYGGAYDIYLGDAYGGSNTTASFRGNATQSTFQTSSYRFLGNQTDKLIIDSERITFGSSIASSTSAYQFGGPTKVLETEGPATVGGGLTVKGTNAGGSSIVIPGGSWIRPATVDGTIYLTTGSNPGLQNGVLTLNRGSTTIGTGDESGARSQFSLSADTLSVDFWGAGSRGLHIGADYFSLIHSGSTTRIEGNSTRFLVTAVSSTLSVSNSEIDIRNGHGSFTVNSSVTSLSRGSKYLTINSSGIQLGIPYHMAPTYNVAMDDIGNLVRSPIAAAGYPRQVVFRLPIDGDSILLGYSSTALNLAKIKVAVNGGTSVTYSVKTADPTGTATVGEVTSHTYVGAAVNTWITGRTTPSGSLEVNTPAAPAALVEGTKVWVEITTVIATVLDITFIIEI